MTAPDPALARPGSRVLLVGAGRPPDGSPLPAVPQVGASLAGLASALREPITHGERRAADMPAHAQSRYAHADTAMLTVLAAPNCHSARGAVVVLD